MLVLSRKASESLLIGDQITIKVLKIKGSTIQLGIEAPKEVPVVRSELRKRAPKDERSEAQDLACGIAPQCVGWSEKSPVSGVPT